MMAPKVNGSLKLTKTNLEVTVEILPALLGFRYPSIAIEMLDSKRDYLLKQSWRRGVMTHLLFPANSSSFPCC